MTAALSIGILDVLGAELGAVEEALFSLEIGAPFRLRVRCVRKLDGAPTANDVLGAEARFGIYRGRPIERNIDCVVAEVAREEYRDRVRYELLLSPLVAPLALGSDSVVYQDKTVPDILEEVLTRAGVSTDRYALTLSGTHAKRTYVVQYDESDWDFLIRLAADDGIFAFFDTASDPTKLVLADASSSLPTVSGGDAFSVRRGSGGLFADDLVFELRRSSTLVSDAVRIVDYDPANPTTKLDSTAKEAGTYEIYDWPGRFRTQADGDARVATMLEALTRDRVRVAGATSSARITPGFRFQVTDHPDPSFNASYFCVACEISINPDRGVSNRWHAIPEAVPYREEPRGRARLARGVQTGVMCGPSGKELHVDDTGRIRVQFYWDRVGKRDQASSTWMRVGQLPLGGSMVLPRVGWDLMVEHHDGDMDAPFVVSHLYDGEHPTPYSLPANKTRTSWQTATTPGGGSSNEIRFEDKAGSEEIFLNASKDMAVTIGDAKKKDVGVDHSHEIGANHAVEIGSNATTGVKADQKVTIGAAETLSISGNSTSQVGGALTASVGAARSLTASSGYSLDADGGRSLTVGAAMMGISALEVSRAVLGSASVTVGGAWISAAATGLDNATAGAGAETVGGAKLQLGGGGVKLNVKGALAETVGGAYVAVASGDAGESGASVTINVGGAFLANSPSIEIDAETQIVICCGGSSITIDSSSIEVKSPALASPGATLKKDGSTIHHNP